MKASPADTRKRAFAICFLLLAGASASALGQAISNPNQIAGTIELTNTNPAILSVLNGPTDSPPGADEGLSRVRVTANSTGSGPVFNNTSTFIPVIPPATRTEADYEITVEAGPPGFGIEYLVKANVRMDASSDTYIFEDQLSTLVEEEPAADASADFSECAGLLDIRWETSSGQPVAVDGGFINAYIQTPSGGFTIQAQDLGITAGSDRELLAVRGDGNFDVDIFFDVGGADFFDARIRLLHEVSVQVSCDEIEEIVCVVPEPGSNELGKIIGQFDVIGEDEHRLVSQTRSLVRVDRGPFGNLRLDWLDGAPSSSPPLPPFELDNLVPSDFTAPATGYRAFVDTTLRRGESFEYLIPPRLDGTINGRVFVDAGQTTDLGDTFVIDPAFVDGEIFLSGPPPGTLGSCLGDIYRDSDRDSNGDGIPNNVFLTSGSHILALGHDELAAGASKTALQGVARTLFEGTTDPLVKDFSGDYEIVVGGLERGASVWSVRDLVLVFRDTATPEVAKSYQSSSLRITDLTVDPKLDLSPGERDTVDHRYCAGQVNLSVLSTAGTFYAPRVSGAGGFTGTDFENNPADYDVSGSIFGTPLTAATAANEGLIVMCLLEGGYDFTPFVTSVNPNGTFSTTELPAIHIDVGCMQVKDITLELQVNLDALPACIDESTTTVTGAAEGLGDDPVFVNEIFATVGGGPQIPFCTACGEDPSFAIDVPLAMCDNDVQVTAVNELGESASTTASTRFDNVAPALVGCDDIAVDDDPETGGALVSYDVTAGDNCDGGLPVACDPPSGSFFPQGSSEVTCAAVDACGNQSACTFTVSVCQPVDPDVRTQGFWKRQCQGPHPSGEHDNLPAYVDPVSALDTFDDVGDVDALCDRLRPQPPNDKCEQAEAQLMAAALNRASGRVASCNCLNDPDLGATTLGEALAFADTLLADPGRTFADCVTAQAIADRINNGDSLVDCAP